MFDAKVDVDSAVNALLTRFGVPLDPAGAQAWLDARIDAAVDRALGDRVITVNLPKAKP